MTLASRARIAKPALGWNGFAFPKWSELRPLLLLAVLFTAELACLSIWLDADYLSRQSILLAGMSLFGARILRFCAAFPVLFVTFAFLRYRVIPGAGSGPVHRGLLSLHALSMAAFAGLSSLLFAHTSPAAGNLTALAWLATGLAGIALGALAFIPFAAWMESLRATGLLWLYALLAALAVAFGGDLIGLAWRPLWNLTLVLVYRMLSLFVSPVIVEPAASVIRAPHFAVSVSEQCAGFEGIGLMLAFGVIWLILFRKECRFPQALLLLPVGVILIYLLNAARITALILIGNAGAQQIALGGFHSQAGWIAFSALSLGLCLLARRVSWITVQPGGAAVVAAEESNPTAAYLMPFLAILAAGMLATAVSAGFEWLYCLRFFSAAAALYVYRDAYRELDWRFGWRGIAAGAALFALWIGMDHSPARPMPHALVAAPAGLRAGWILFRALAAVVTVPVAEELAFRGFLLRRLKSAGFESVPWSRVGWPALLVSSLLFGLMHGPRWPAGALAGLLFGWLAMRTGRIGEAVAAHAATNALIAIYVLAGGQWQLW